MIAAGAIILVLAAQALSAYVLSAWFGAAFQDPSKHSVSAFTCVFVVLAAYSMPRVLAGFDLGPRARATIAAVVTFAVLYGILRLEFAGDFALWDFGWLADFLAEAQATTQAGSDVIVGAGFVIPLWAWGLWRSEQDVELEFIPRSLAGPFAAVTIIVILATPSSAIGEVGRGAAAFYAVAIIALTLSQLARSGATIGTLRAGGVTGALLSGTLATTIVGVILFGLLWGPFSGPIGTVLGNTIEVVLTIVLTPVAWVFAKIASLLLGGAVSPEDIRQVPADITGTLADEDDDRSTASRVAAFIFRLLALAIVVGAVAVGLAFLTRMRRRRERRPGTGPSVTSAGGIAEDLLGLAASLIPRWRRRRTTASADDDAIRLYTTVLREAEDRGHPRAPARTPDEFAPELADTFASHVTDDITLAFEEARYAGRPPDPATVRELERRWRTGTPDQ